MSLNDKPVMLEDNPQFGHLIFLWDNLSVVLENDFEPYLPLVIPTIMQAAAMKVDFEEIDINFMDTKTHKKKHKAKSSENKVNRKRVNIRAYKMLSRFLVKFPATLFKYVELENIVKIMFTIFQYQKNNDVFTEDEGDLYYLLEYAQTKGTQCLKNLWSIVCSELLKSIEKDIHISVLLLWVRQMNNCMCLIDHFSALETMTTSVRIIDKLMKDDYSDHIFIDFYPEMIFLIQKLCSSYRSEFLPYFNDVVHYFANMLSSDRSDIERENALKVFTTLVEFKVFDIVTYQKYFASPIIQNITDKFENVQEAAVQICGVLAQFGGEDFADVCTEALSKLMKVINNDEYKNMNDSTKIKIFSAILKILKCHSGSINIEMILPWFSSQLLLFSNEANAIYEYLFDLMRKNDQIILGPRKVNLPRILFTISENFDRLWLSRTKIIAILRNMQSDDKLAFERSLFFLSGKQHKNFDIFLESH